MTMPQTLTLGPDEALRKNPFTSYDVGWIVLCIGMAIGSPRFTPLE